jgi:hypothetical protein
MCTVCEVNTYCKLEKLQFLTLCVIFCKENRLITFPARAHLRIKPFLPCIQAAFGHSALGWGFQCGAHMSG